MGLFNFIYKLTNILSNKKKLRIFLIIAIAIVLVFCWSRGAFAYTTDATPSDAQALTNYQLVLQQALISQLRYQYYSKPSGYDATAMKNLTDKMYWYNVYVTPGDYSGNNNALYDVFTYSSIFGQNDADIFTTPGQWSVGINSGTSYECMIGNFTANSYTKVMQGGGNRISPVYSGNSTTIHLPDACYMVRSCAIDEFLADIGYGSGSIHTTYNTNDDELQALTQAGFQNQVNAINNATSSINDVNSSVEDVNDSVQDVNQSVMDMINTIVDPYVNVTQEQLPQSNVQDTTEDGLDNIFTIIKNAFTGTPQAVSFPVPFTNQSFTIEPGFTENSMKKGGLNAMVSVIHLYWYYRIYSFIFLKYVELLEKLKEGEFEETVGNIKKEVL